MKTFPKYTAVVLLIAVMLTMLAPAAIAEARHQDSVEPASAATHYVSITGNNSNPGTQGQPWRTIQKAANSAPGGAIIQVESGNYGEDVSISRSGLSFRANGTVITRSVFISGNTNSLSGFEITGASGHGLNVFGKSVLVENNIVHWNSLANSTNGKCNSTSGGSWQSGIKLSVGADNVTVRNNVSFNNCGEGIAVTRGINSVVENNVVYDNFSANIYIDNSKDITVRNNTVTCSDINMRDGSRAKGIYLGAEYYSGWGNQRRNIYLLQNSISDCEYGIVLGDGYDGGLTANISIDSNTIPSGTYRSISVLSSNNQNIVVQNNLIFNPIYVSHPNGVTLVNNQIITPSYIISGNVGEAGVVLSYIDGGAKSVTTDTNGNYTITVPYTWGGTITPSKTGFGFNPAQRTYSNVNKNRTQENYTVTWAGGIAIQSNQPVVAVARPHLGGPIASYIGSTAGSATQFVPMLFKGAFGGGYNAALYVQNISNNSASLTMQFINSNGAVVYTKNDTLGANASKGYWLPSEAGLPNGFAGGVKVTSNRNIIALGRPHINGQVMTYNGMAAGSTTAWLPMFFKNGFGSYNTALYIQNVTANSANLTIEYLNLDGTVACTDTDSLGANASKGYWSLSVACDMGSLPGGFVGGVKVTSTHDILAVGRAHLGTQITTYNGFDGGATSAYAPMLFRKAYAGGSYNAALYLQNVSGFSADVTIEYVNNNGVVVATQNVTLAAGAISSLWLPSVAGLPDGFVGGARIAATQDVIVVGRPHLGGQITAYNGTSTGSLNAYLPMLFKNAYAAPYQAAFYIQNVTGSAATVDISFYNEAGTLSCVKTINLAANATQGFWMPTVVCAP